MQMGQTRIIQVPPSMAYGDKGIKVETKDGTEEVHAGHRSARVASLCPLATTIANRLRVPRDSQYLVPPGERLQFEITLVQVALPPP